MIRRVHDLNHQNHLEYHALNQELTCTATKN